MNTDLKLKLIRFWRKNSKIIFIAICVWIIVFIINRALKNYNPPTELQTTYEPHTSVIDDTSSVPEKISDPIEEMIEKYVGYCNEGNVESAFDMLSDSCKEYCFDNDIEEFVDYLSTKRIGKMQYAIQDFSNRANTYIYQVKYTKDLLATGLTDTTYQYTEEKMIFKKQKNGKIEMSVGNFVDMGDIKNISENEYLKIDVKKVIKYYSIERYFVKFTNRSDYTVVVSDGVESNEVSLLLDSGDARDRNNYNAYIVLKPNESKTIVLDFPKYCDNGDNSVSLNFDTIRVMEKYSGTAEDISEEVKQSEIQNAISKFSVSIPVDYE